MVVRTPQEQISPLLEVERRLRMQQRQLLSPILRIRFHPRNLLVTAIKDTTALHQP
jgi:hypothetical protein